MNNVVLMGRLVKEVELKYLESNQVARFTLAVDKNLAKDKKEELESRNQPTADFINCVAWGKLAENISKYTGKGLRVLVNGRIQTGSYEKDGQRVYTTDVVVSNIEYIDWKDGNNQNGYNKGYAIDATVANNTSIEKRLDYPDDFDPTEDRRIPF